MSTPENLRFLLYVGVASDSLRKRYHPAAQSSRTSSPRFSFGALLRERLTLIPSPAKQNQTRHWRFIRDSEDELSRWMHAHLEYAFIELTKTREVLEKWEKDLIHRWLPPMNIKGLPRTSRVALIEKREICRRWARGMPP